MVLGLRADLGPDGFVAPVVAALERLVGVHRHHGPEPTEERRLAVDHPEEDSIDVRVHLPIVGVDDLGCLHLRLEHVRATQAHVAADFSAELGVRDRARHVTVAAVGAHRGLGPQHDLSAGHRSRVHAVRAQELDEAVGEVLPGVRLAGLTAGEVLAEPQREVVGLAVERERHAHRRHVPLAIVDVARVSS